MLLTLTIGTSSSSIGISTYVGASDGLGHNEEPVKKFIVDMCPKPSEAPT